MFEMNKHLSNNLKYALEQADDIPQPLRLL